MVYGIAASIAELYALTGLDVEFLQVDGGLTNSRALIQAQADLLQIPVRAYHGAHATAQGAAALARVALDGQRTIELELDSVPGAATEPVLPDGRPAGGGLPRPLAGCGRWPSQSGGHHGLAGLPGAEVGPDVVGVRAVVHRNVHDLGPEPLGEALLGRHRVAAVRDISPRPDRAGPHTAPPTGAGRSRSKIRPRRPSGEPSVMKASTGHCGLAHSAS